MQSIGATPNVITFAMSLKWSAKPAFVNMPIANEKQALANENLNVTSSESLDRCSNSVSASGNTVTRRSTWSDMRNEPEATPELPPREDMVALPWVTSRGLLRLATVAVRLINGCLDGSDETKYSVRNLQCYIGRNTNSH